MLKQLLLLALALVGSHARAASTQAPEDQISFVTVKYHDAAELQAIASQFQHVIVDKKTKSISTEAAGSDIAALRGAGLRVSIDTVATAKLRSIEAALARTGSLKSIPGYACYRTVEETHSTMATLASSYPNLAQVADLGPSFEKSRNSALGYTMKVLKLTNAATNASIPNKPNMVLLGAIHAREYTTAELMTRFGEWLVQNHGTNAEATWLLDNYRFHLVLQTNPDGRKKAETGLSWRKNTNNTAGSCSSSSFGVDLNRNFPFHWSTVSGGSSPNPCVDTYRGVSAASEPETANVMRYVAGTRGTDGTYTGGVLPDRRLDATSSVAPSDYAGMFMDIHSYSQLVLWPWGDSFSMAPNGAQLRTLGRRLAWHNSYSPEQSSELYATDGATDDSMYGLLGAPAFTLELGVAFFESCTTFNNATLPKNLAALRYAARNLQSPYTLPAGPDTTAISLSASTIAQGGVLTLNATVDDSRFNQSNGTETTQAISSARAYIDKLPWAAGAVPIALSATDGSFNAVTESVRGSISTAGLSPGVHLIYVQGTDAAGKAGTPNAVRFTVTGGGNLPPVSSFNFTTSGLTASFTDASSDPDGSVASRSWSFGDGGTSTLTNPSRTYAAAGTYTVTLTVTDNLGATHASSRSVTVTSAANQPPVANFNFTTNALTASFTDASSDLGGAVASRSWNFGDGSTSTAVNPTRTYAAAGTYTVTLAVTDNLGATHSTSRSVTVSNGGGLGNGVPVTGISGARLQMRAYTIVVPAGASNLRVTTNSGSGDADLYLRFGSAPTTSTYTCRSIGSTNTESCLISAPSAGTYHIGVYGYSAFSGLTLTASYQSP